MGVRLREASGSGRSVLVIYEAGSPRVSFTAWEKSQAEPARDAYQAVLQVGGDDKDLVNRRDVC